MICIKYVGHNQLGTHILFDNRSRNV